MQTPKARFYISYYGIWASPVRYILEETRDFNFMGWEDVDGQKVGKAWLLEPR